MNTHTHHCASEHCPRVVTGLLASRFSNESCPLSFVLNVEGDNNSQLYKYSRPGCCETASSASCKKGTSGSVREEASLAATGKWSVLTAVQSGLELTLSLSGFPWPPAETKITLSCLSRWTSLAEGKSFYLAFVVASRPPEVVWRNWWWRRISIDT